MPTRRHVIAASLVLPFAGGLARPAWASWPLKVQGNPDAPVEVREFSSLTCPACAQLHAQSLPALKAEYVETGRIRYVFRDFPLDLRAWFASAVAHCAGEEVFFAFVDVLFQEQRRWAGAASNAAARTRLEESGLPAMWRDAGRGPQDIENLMAVAGTVNTLVDLAQLAGVPAEHTTACLADFELLDWVLEGYQEGRDVYGVEATPTLIIDGERHTGVQSAADLGRAIDAALARY